jgi:hypothetical protein
VAEGERRRVTALVGALIGACAIIFGVIAIVRPAALRRRFDGRDNWIVVQDQERDFDPRVTRVSGVVLAAAGVTLVVLSALGVFG